jgi:hypothetical protein
MKRSVTAVMVAITIMATAVTLAAQSKTRGKKPTNGTTAKPNSESQGGDSKSDPDLASDPRIQDLQKDFVRGAARLAQEYERKKDLEGARSCYEYILRVVPNHPAAKEALDRIRGDELTAEKVKKQIKAAEDWQDTGVNVIANRPIKIHAEGRWTFKLEAEVDANGWEIPEELKDFKLGCLIGKIVTSGNPDDNAPFEIGKEKEITPDAPGRLFLRMFDSDPRDNKGILSVEINGTFKKGK